MKFALTRSSSCRIRVGSEGSLTELCKQKEKEEVQEEEECPLAAGVSLLSMLSAGIEANIVVDLSDSSDDNIDDESFASEGPQQDQMEQEIMDIEDSNDSNDSNDSDDDDDDDDEEQESNLLNREVMLRQLPKQLSSRALGVTKRTSSFKSMTARKLPTRSLGNKSMSFSYRGENRRKLPSTGSDSSDNPINKTNRVPSRRSLGEKSKSFSCRSSKIAAIAPRPATKEERSRRKPSLMDCSNHIAKRKEHQNDDNNNGKILSSRSAYTPSNVSMSSSFHSTASASSCASSIQKKADLSTSNHSSASRSRRPGLGARSQSFSVRAKSERFSKKASLFALHSSSFHGDLNIDLSGAIQEEGENSPIKPIRKLSSSSNAYELVTMIQPDEGFDHRSFLQFNFVNPV